MIEKVARALAKLQGQDFDDKQMKYALKDTFLRQAMNAIMAYEKALKVRGLVVVPKKPTSRMIEELYGEFLSSTAHQARIDSYKDMLTVSGIKD